MTLFQGLLLGPLGHVYYTNLDAKVHPESAKAPTTVVTKMLIDQLIFAPLATLAFYAYKCAAERRFRQLRRELRDKYLPTMVANWKLWPAAHIINFAFVPTEQRILFANVVSVLGVYILSRAAAGDFSGAAGAKRRPWQQHLQRRSSQQAQLLVPLIPVGAAAATPHQQRQLSQRAPAPTLRATSQQLQQQEEGGGGPGAAGRAAAAGLGLAPVAAGSGQHVNPARSPFAQAALCGIEAQQKEVEVKLE
ncbi:hypothetical protein N2152v2_003578 [Parachlorella kessleri]